MGNYPVPVVDLRVKFRINYDYTKHSKLINSSL